MPMPDNIFTNAQGAGEFGIYSTEVPTHVPAEHTDKINESDYLYRMVFRFHIPDTEVVRLLGPCLDEESSLASAGVTWIHRQEWNHASEPFMSGQLLEDLHIANGLYYIAASERIQSSMELSCRMGRDVAKPLYYDRMAPRYPWRPWV